MDLFRNTELSDSDILEKARHLGCQSVRVFFSRQGRRNKEACFVSGLSHENGVLRSPSAIDSK